MTTIEQFTKETFEALNSDSLSKDQLKAELNEACNLLIYARISASSLSILQEKRDAYKTLLTKYDEPEFKGIVRMALNTIEHDIEKIERLGVYFGV